MIILNQIWLKMISTKHSTRLAGKAVRRWHGTCTGPVRRFHNPHRHFYDITMRMKLIDLIFYSFLIIFFHLNVQQCIYNQNLRIDIVRCVQQCKLQQCTATMQRLMSVVWQLAQALRPQLPITQTVFPTLYFMSQNSLTFSQNSPK